LFKYPSSVDVEDALALKDRAEYMGSPYGREIIWGGVTAIIITINIVR
jgi:hypothetical protein